METPRSPKSLVRSKRSSRGRIHNAIETSNGFVVRALLAMGLDVEELDSNGRTPLVHAIMKHEDAICKLLLEKGACASAEALQAFTSRMDLKGRSELLDPLITRALDNGTPSVYRAVLRLMVLMALGTNYGGDGSRSPGWSMMNVAIDMGYNLAIRAIIHLEPQVLVEVDTEGRTPLVYAAVNHHEAVCKLLLEKGASVEALKAFTSGMDIEERSGLLEPLINKATGDSSTPVTVLRLLVLMTLGTNYGGDDNRSPSRSMMNVAIDMSYNLAVRAIIHLEPQVLVEVDTAGRTPFAYAYHLRRNEICEMLLQASKIDTGIATEVVKSEGDFSGRVHAVILENCLQLLWLQLISIFSTSMGVLKAGTEGQIPLAHAADVILINSEDINCGSWNYIFQALLTKAPRANIEIMAKIQPKPGDR